MVESYKTIASISEGVYKEKGSKFFAYAHPVSSREEAKELNKFYRKKYYDARHHCFAYQINPQNLVTRAADDGEPSNSAGAPILGQIHSFELCNVMIMVVRYFGGTKLGVPGLINAYRSAAKDALNQASIIEKKIEATLTFKFEYPEMDKVMQVIKKYNLNILHQTMELNCVFRMSYHIEHAVSVLDEFENINGEIVI